ncbi:MAG TPA: outer membrane beta-barrel protein [Burkholderiales bacterium]
MKRIVLAAIACVAALAAQAVPAQENPIYVGIKAGEMDPDADANGFDPAANLGLMFGYRLAQNYASTFSLEGEYTRNLSRGDIEGAGRWRIETLALYGVYRSGEYGYVKVKAGALRQDVSCTGTGRSICGRESGISYGAGLGFRLNEKVGIELEYTVIEEDIAFVSIGYFSHF